MAVMRLAELKEMSNDALESRLTDLEAEIARERGLAKSAGKPSNPGKYREMRKVLARIKTILRQRGKRI